MRRFDKNKNMERANLLVEQRYLEDNSLNSAGYEDEANAFLREIQNDIYEALGTKQRLDEDLDIIASVLGWIKKALTSQRVGELFTGLIKLIYKWLGIDKDLSGVVDDCEKADSKSDIESRGFAVAENEDGEGANGCEKLLIQKLSDKLLSVHKLIVKLLNWVAAAIKYKTFKPTDEQKKSSEGLGKIMFNTIIIGCLIYYLQAMGHDISSGDYANASFMFMGALTKASDLYKTFNDGLHDINTSTKH